MNDRQENFYSMCLRVDKRLDLNLPIVSSLVALNTARTSFKNQLQTIRDIDLIVTKKLTGVSQDKKVLKVAVANSCVELSSAICSFATSVNNNTLYEEIYKPASNILDLRDDQLPIYANNIIARLNEFLANLADYGITVTIVSNFTNLVNDYTSFSSTPRVAAATRKTATADLAKQIKDTRNFLIKSLDKLVNTLKPTQPTFVSQYFNDRNIYDDGSSNNVLKIYKGTLPKSAFKNLGELPEETLKLRITLLSGGPLEVGLSVDGITFNGNTITLGGIGSETVVIVDLNSIGTLILLRNQSATLSAKFKVEALK
jgi:hypothetical protein